MKRKAQEEIVGFVLIVVLVAIIAVVFLGIMLRNNSDPSLPENKEIESFQIAVKQYTTNCEFPSGRFQTIGDLILRCYENKNCANNNQNACEVLEQELKEIMESSSYIVEEGSRFKYYNLKIFYGENLNLISPIQKYIENMECRGTKSINTLSSSTISGEEISFRLEVCYN
jgi:hypothetical protein